jgi:hypothetical protein
MLGGHVLGGGREIEHRDALRRHIDEPNDPRGDVARPAAAANPHGVAGRSA